MAPDFLEPCVGLLNENEVAAVRELEDDPTAYPAGYMRPRPMEQHDVRLFFRQMEVELGYVFASHAAEILLEAMEGLKGTIREMNPRKLQEHLVEMVPGLTWPHEPKTPEEALLGAEFPGDRLPLAAKEPGAKAGVAVCATISGGRVKGFSPLLFEEFLTQRAGVKLFVSGRVRLPAVSVRGSELWGLLTVKDGSNVSPGRVEWDDAVGSFYLEFDHVPDDFRLAVAVVAESEGE